MSDLADFGDNVTFRRELPGGQARLKEAALYVMHQAKDFDYFGLVKLNKMLWRADFTSFLDRKFPVTGRPYQKIEHGPAPVEMKPVLRDLETEGLISFISSAVPNEQRPIPTGEPERINLSPLDIEFLDEAIAFYRDMTATATSKQSHGVAWDTRQMNDWIPYDAAIFDDVDQLPQELEHRLMWMGRERRWKTA